MQSANSASTPMTRDTIGEDSSDAFTDIKSYRSLIGALSHLARFTRPDVMFPVFYLARFQSAPTPVSGSPETAKIMILRPTVTLIGPLLKQIEKVPPGT